MKIASGRQQHPGLGQDFHIRREGLKTRGQENLNPIKEPTCRFTSDRVRFASTPQREVRIEGCRLLACDLGQAKVTPGDQRALGKLSGGASRRPDPREQRLGLGEQQRVETLQADQFLFG